MDAFCPVSSESPQERLTLYKTLPICTLSEIWQSREGAQCGPQWSSCSNAGLLRQGPGCPKLQRPESTETRPKAEVGSLPWAHRTEESQKQQQSLNRHAVSSPSYWWVPGAEGPRGGAHRKQPVRRAPAVRSQQLPGTSSGPLILKLSALQPEEGPSDQKQLPMRPPPRTDIPETQCARPSDAMDQTHPRARSREG